MARLSQESSQDLSELSELSSFRDDAESRALLREKVGLDAGDLQNRPPQSKRESSARKRRVLWLMMSALVIWVLAQTGGDVWRRPIDQYRANILAKDDYRGRETWRGLFGTRRPKVRPHHKLRKGQRKVTPVVPESVCIMAIDNRPLDMTLAPDGNLYNHSAATVSQLSWALRHGYQYRRFKPTEDWTPLPHNPTWNKMPAYRDSLTVCQWSILMDGDVFVHDARWSLDDLRLKWGIHDGVSIFAANDPPFSEGEVNTGFMIAQQTPKSFLALEKLISCLDEVPECREWAFKPRHEQTAFERFIVHKYLVEDEDFVRGTCGEANGYWRYEHSPEVTCDGKVFAHAWGWKEDISQDTRPLYGMDVMRILLQQFQDYPELRSTFAAVPKFHLDNKDTRLVSEILRESGDSSGSAAAGQEGGRQSMIDPSSVCVVAIDGREVDEDVRETRAGQPHEMDGTMATSYLQMAYAVRHGYQYRRVALPAFPDHPQHHAYWRSVEPLLEAIEACPWTMYFSQAAFPYELDVGIDDLLDLWQVPAAADITAFSGRQNFSYADLGFLLIQRSSESIAAMRALNACQTNDCLGDTRGSWEHLSDVFNQVVRPSAPSEAVHVVPFCEGSESPATGHACNSHIWTPREPGWHDNLHWYLVWSDDMASRAARIIGTAVQRYLLGAWQTYDLREQPFSP